MKIKYIIFMFIFILSIFTFIFLLNIKHEIGKNPSKQQQKEFEKLPYYTNGKFFNIYQPINGFKNINENEDNYKKMSFPEMVKNLFTIEKVKINSVQLNKESFSKNINNFNFYWLGHASVLLEIDNKRILIDPVFGNASPVKFIVKRNIKSPVDINNLPQIDYIIISHNHYDHLERTTIQKLKNSKFIVPLGVGESLRYWGVKNENIIEVGWGDKIKISQQLNITAEPAMHFSGRWLKDGNNTLWNSYVITQNDKKIFYAGDTAYGEHIDMIANKYKKFNLVLMEIDAWNVRWPYLHSFTRESIEVIKKLKTDYFLPVHWGVFGLGMHKLDTSIKMLKNEIKKAKLEDKLLLPAIGEKVVFDNNNKAKYKLKSI